MILQPIDSVSTDSVKIQGFADMGYFAHNPLMHEEIALKNHGFVAQRLPYNIWDDTIITLAILICTLLTAILVRRTTTFVKHQKAEFFLPPRTGANAVDLSSTLGSTMALGITILLTAVCTLIFYYYAVPALTTHAITLSLYTMLAVYAGCILGYFIIKRIFSQFINWIFFNKINRQIWQQVYNFILLIETVLLLPTAIVVVYLPIPPYEGLLCAFTLILVAKLALFYKCKMIFFPKLHGFFHLMSYLCALEVTPMLALWVLLSAVTGNVTVQI